MGYCLWHVRCALKYKIRHANELIIYNIFKIIYSNNFAFHKVIYNIFFEGLSTIHKPYTFIRSQYILYSTKRENAADLFFI